MKNELKIYKPYLFGVLALVLIFPFLSVTAECLLNNMPVNLLEIIGKWFLF